MEELNLLTPEHKVIAMFRVSYPYGAYTIKTFNSDEFLEMTKNEKDYPIIEGYINGKMIDISLIKTLKDLRRHFMPMTDLSGQISIFDLI